MNLASSVLEGRFVRLQPFTEDLREPVRAALAGPDPVWAILATSAEGERFDAWWDLALAELRAGRRIPYAVLQLSDGAIVGSTSFLNIDAASRSVEIGSTFLRPTPVAAASTPT
jgi:RimJ/RimL family protein N-acetyltransferase